jgi:MraZ protein
VFQGASQLTLDEKGRVSIPTRHRDALMAQCEGRLTLTRHPDGCLLVYPRPEWQARLKDIAELPYESRALRRLLLGNAADTEIDSAGRVLVPAELRTAARLERDVMLLGMASHFELWDLERMAQQEQSQLAQALPQSAALFRF